MNKIRVNLVLLGSNACIFNQARIKNHNSSLFTISHVEEVPHLPQMDGEEWNYSRQTLGTMVKVFDNYGISFLITIFLICADLS